MSIVKKSVNTTSVEKIAEIENVIKDTKILANIGLMVVVIEENNVPFSTKKPMNQEKYIQEEAEAGVTQEAGAEVKAWKVRELLKELG